MRYADLHHALQLNEGQLDVSIDENSVKLSAGETVYIPMGLAFSIRVGIRFAQAYIFSNGGG